MLNELIKKKKELEQQILDLTKNGRLNEVGEVSEELKKVEKDIFSLLDDETTSNSVNEEPTFLESFPKAINQTADILDNEIDDAFSNVCSDCDYQFPIDNDQTAPICTNCGSTSQASKQRVFKTTVGIFATLGAAFIAWIGLFLGPFAIVAWVISFCLGLIGVSFFFSFIGFFVLPIYYKLSWFLACLVSKRGTTANHYITRYMLLITLIGLVLFSYIIEFLSEHTHIFS